MAVERGLGVGGGNASSSDSSRALYPMCVNTETLAEMALIGLPLGVYGICLGIDSHSVKKNK